jgi:hypothetical protein
MKTARLLGLLGALGLGAIGAAVVSVPAHAAAVPDCRTSVTNLIDRPDSGITDTWALDTFTRTVQICVVSPSAETAAAALATSTYHAVVTDAGTFKTLAAHSPQAGTPLAADVPGTLSGGFTADFTAAPGFTDYNGKLDGKTFTGNVGGDNPSTGNWIATLFDGGIVSGSGLNDDWSWTYKTCTEQWVNANSGNSGDITGLPTCPPPTTAAAPDPSLPVTGANVGRYVVMGGAALVVGVVLVMFAGRVRRRSE